jgi:transketolase N-terminal domain/subunit/transketolase C-terminal domain/subunit
MFYQDIKQERLFARAFLKLLEIKDSDIRLLTILQGKTAVDRGIHVGGAFSSVIPLTALYYGGVMNYDVEQPTKPGQDLFVLSKGHGIAALASVYADLGYFPESYLENSRCYDSLLNGHPGPVLPGIHTATGPLGQGICVAQGFALAARAGKGFDVFVLTGDGELQEGIPWESVIHAGAKRLDNLCVLIDKNEGQLDNPGNLTYSMDGLEGAFRSFGWDVVSVDATQYEPVLGALRDFKFGARNGKPRAVICNSRKGFGGLSGFMIGHKVDFSDPFADQEMAQQKLVRANRVMELADIIDSSETGADSLRSFVSGSAGKMGLLISDGNGGFDVHAAPRTVKTRRAPVRNKEIVYRADQLPVLEDGKKYSAQEIVTGAMKVFAMDPKVMSVDSDLASTSGLEAGVGYVDRRRSFNVGIAEANMMCIGESFAALGFNSWVSTFAPFFNWQVFRRIAVGYQERMESIGRKEGWLSAGHGLDITFLATAPNFETKTNGATHMGNDDITVYNGIAHLKIIDVSCPRLLLGIMKWIMEGDKGLVYLRILRSAAPVIYPGDFKFEYARGFYVSKPPAARAYIVSSGHGVYEALGASKILEERGVKAAVIDMPSFDPKMAEELAAEGKPVIIAEQNNGYLWACFRGSLFGKKFDPEKLVPINLLDKDGNPRFLHSATYEELTEHNGLSPRHIADRVSGALEEGR